MSESQPENEHSSFQPSLKLSIGNDVYAYSPAIPGVAEGGGLSGPESGNKPGDRCGEGNFSRLRVGLVDADELKSLLFAGCQKGQGDRCAEADFFPGLVFRPQDAGGGDALPKGRQFCVENGPVATHFIFVVRNQAVLFRFEGGGFFFEQTQARGGNVIFLAGGQGRTGRDKRKFFLIGFSDEAS